MENLVTNMKLKSVMRRPIIDIPMTSVLPKRSESCKKHYFSGEHEKIRITLTALHHAVVMQVSKPAVVAITEIDYH